MYGRTVIQTTFIQLPVNIAVSLLVNGILTLGNIIEKGNEQKANSHRVCQGIGKHNILLKTLHIERERLLQNCAKTRKGITKNPTQHLSLRRSSEPVRTPGYTLLLRLCIKFEFQSNRLTKPQDFTAVYEIWGPDKAPKKFSADTH